MDYIKADLDKMKNKEEQLKSIANAIHQIKNSYLSIAKSINCDIRNRDNIDSSINKIYKELGRVEENVYTSGAFITIAENEYISAEKRLKLYHDNTLKEINSRKSNSEDLMDDIKKISKKIKNTLKSSIEHIKDFFDTIKQKINNTSISDDTVSNQDNSIEDIHKESFMTSYGFTSEQYNLFKKAFGVIEENYKDESDKAKYINNVVRLLAPLCLNYDSKRFRLTANTPSRARAMNKLTNLGLSESEVLDLIIMINVQHLPYDKEKLAKLDIDLEQSSFSNRTHDDYMNGNDGIKKDFAHELIQYAIFSNSLPDDYEPGIFDIFNGKLRRSLVDVFNSDLVYSYTNYEASFKGDIDSTRWDMGDFASDVDAINIYSRMQKSDSIFNAIMNYNSDVMNGDINRAQEFFCNLGDGHEDIGILELLKILDVETMGSQYIIGDNEEEVEEGKKAFVQWIFEQYQD